MVNQRVAGLFPGRPAALGSWATDPAGGRGRLISPAFTSRLPFDVREKTLERPPEGMSMSCWKSSRSS
jgi:hypothetical protein